MLVSVEGFQCHELTRAPSGGINGGTEIETTIELSKTRKKPNNNAAHKPETRQICGGALEGIEVLAT